jgi:hypothetical protein
MMRGPYLQYLTWAAWGAGALVIAYVLAAYVAIPALWSRYEHRPDHAAGPLVTVTAQGIPGDPLNVGLVGSREGVMRAMKRAGWHPADPITLKSSVEIGLDVVLGRPYADAPVSSLFYQGRRQDLAFELPVGNSPSRRHHVRFWRTPGSAGTQGRELWLGSATFDRGVGVSHDTGQITHHIGADLDAERGFFMRSLGDSGALSQIYLVPGIGPTLRGRNGGGDLYYTDGDVMIGVLVAGLESTSAAPGVKPALPDNAAKHRIWGAVVAVGRFLRILPAHHHGP